MSQQISIPALVDWLKRDDLLIVKRVDYENRIHFGEMKLRALQKRLLAKDSMTIKEIIKAQLLPVTTRQSINNWIDAGKIANEEVFLDTEGTTRVATSAIIRLRTLKNLG